MTVVLVRTVLREGPLQWGSPRGADIVVRKDGWIVSAMSAAVPLAFDHGAVQPVTDEHLRAELDEADPAWLAIADVCVRPRVMTGGPPGCLTLATVERDRTCVVVRGEEAMIDVPAPRSPEVFASFVHTWKVSGRLLASLHGASFMTADRAWRRIRVSRPPDEPATS